MTPAGRRHPVPGPLARLAAAGAVAGVSLLVAGGLASPSWASFLANSATADSSVATQDVQAPVLTAAASRPAGAVALTWSATPTAAQRPDLTFVYSVYRSAGATGTPVLVTAAPVSGLSFTDTPPADGTWTYSVVASVSSFRSAPSTALTGLSDRVAPAVALQCGGGPCGTAWSRTPLTVSLAASDAGSGVQSITYSLDGVSTTIVGATAAFTVGDGAHTLTYGAADRAGNVSIGSSQALNVDSTAPVIAAAVLCSEAGAAPPAAAGWVAQGGAYRVLANLTDATSGVASASATVTASAGALARGVALTAQAVTCGGVSFTYASGPLTAPSPLAAGSGTLTLTVTAGDVAGNAASFTGSGSVDDAAGTISSFKVQSGGPRSGRLTATWAASDPLSGVGGYEVDVYLAGTTTRPPQYPGPVILPAATTSLALNLVSGTRYDVTLVMADNAGNDTAPASQLGRRAG